MKNYESKLQRLVKSRKFWAAVAAIVTIVGAYSTGHIDGWQATQGVIAALAAYSIGTGIEDNGNPPPSGTGSPS